MTVACISRWTVNCLRFKNIYHSPKLVVLFDVYFCRSLSWHDHRHNKVCDNLLHALLNWKISFSRYYCSGIMSKRLLLIKHMYSLNMRLSRNLQITQLSLRCRLLQYAVFVGINGWHGNDIFSRYFLFHVMASRRRRNSSIA